MKLRRLQREKATVWDIATCGLWCGHLLRYCKICLYRQMTFRVTNSISFCGTGRRATFWDISNCGELVMPYIEVTLNVVLIFVRTIKCFAHSALFHYKYWKRDETSTFAKREGHSLRYRNLWLMVRSSFALLQNMSLPANDISSYKFYLILWHRKTCHILRHFKLWWISNAIHWGNAKCGANFCANH